MPLCPTKEKANGPAFPPGRLDILNIDQSLRTAITDVVEAAPIVSQLDLTTIIAAEATLTLGCGAIDGDRASAVSVGAAVTASRISIDCRRVATVAACRAAV